MTQRAPRERCAAFLSYVRTKRCCVCFAQPVHAAHIRMAAPHLGKRATGMAEKPSDRWCVPLCPRCHQDGPKAQHKMNEAEFWRMNGIDPFKVAAALWSEFKGEK